MSDYLRMSDVFEGKVKAKHVDEDALEELNNGEDSGKNWTFEDDRYWLAMSYEHAGYAAHAVNTHDDLVAEVERLRLMLSECYPYIKDKADWGNEYEVGLADRVFDASK